jgi:hypothetical protein
MEIDLFKQGIESITTNCLAWIAPIAVRQYGFTEISRRTYEDLQKSFLQLLPWKTVELEKKLTCPE